MLISPGRVLTCCSQLEDMKDDGVERSVVSFNAALVACERGGEWRDAEALFDELAETDGLEPGVCRF